jgi:hypothetical protein
MVQVSLIFPTLNRAAVLMRTLRSIVAVMRPSDPVEIIVVDNGLTDRTPEAHCRRSIFDVWQSTKSTVAKAALDRIAQFYAIEDKARFAPPDERPARPRKGPCFLAVAAGRIGSGFFTPMRNHSLPGRHITDCQTRL